MEIESEREWAVRTHTARQLTPHFSPLFFLYQWRFDVCVFLCFSAHTIMLVGRSQTVEVVLSIHLSPTPPTDTGRAYFPLLRFLRLREIWLCFCLCFLLLMLVVVAVVLVARFSLSSPPITTEWVGWSRFLFCFILLLLLLSSSKFGLEEEEQRTGGRGRMGSDE
jgi:hypothetical protein